MDDTVRVTVDLPRELARELERAVDQGEAPDASEIVKAALWRWKAHHIDFTESEVIALRKMIDEADAEEDVPGFDIDQMIAEERARPRG